MSPDWRVHYFFSSNGGTEVKLFLRYFYPLRDICWEVGMALTISELNLKKPYLRKITIEIQFYINIRAHRLYFQRHVRLIAERIRFFHSKIISAICL